LPLGHHTRRSFATADPLASRRQGRQGRFAGSLDEEVRARAKL
jgi:hypothetical protein